MVTVVVVAVVDVCCLVTSNNEQSRGISSRSFYSLVASHWKRDVDNSNIAKTITKVNNLPFRKGQSHGRVVF